MLYIGLAAYLGGNFKRKIKRYIQFKYYDNRCYIFIIGMANLYFNKRMLERERIIG